MTESSSTIAPADPRHGRKVPAWAYLLGAVVLLGIAFPIAWNNGLRARLFPRNFGVVEPGVLYRSGQINSRLIEATLRDHGIRRIISLTNNGPRQADIDAEEKAAADLGIDRTVYPLGGKGTGKIERYADAIEAIEKARKDGKPALVHCVAGAQRTGGVVATYLMLVRGVNADEAYKQMYAYGHDPNENPQLLTFINEHMGELAQMLVDRGVIAKVPQPLPVLKAE